MENGRNVAMSVNRRHFHVPSWLLRHIDSLGKYSIYMVEFLGTFFLVMTIGFCAVKKIANGPFAIGSVLMSTVFMGGHISGAHYNPAVTFGVYLTGRGKISTYQSIGYVFSQIFGSICASLTVWHVAEDSFQPEPGPGITYGEAVSIEFLWTFLLVSVVLNTATTKSQQDNSFYGLAIGFTVLAGATAVGGLSGGAFNPAVGFGPTLVHVMNHGTVAGGPMWIYWVGPLLGATIAAVGFRITNHHKEYRTADYGDLVEVDGSAPLMANQTL